MIRNPENQFAVSVILNSGSFPWTQTPESLKYGGKGNMHFFFPTSLPHHSSVL